MTIKEDALYAVAIKALADFAKERSEEIRGLMMAELTAFYDETGAKSVDVKLIDGTKVATIPLSFSRDGFRVENPTAFVDYVEKVQPLAIRKTVDANWQRTYLAGLTNVDGEAVDPETGEVVPGLGAVPGGVPKSYSVRYANFGRDAMLEAIGRGELGNLLAGGDEIPALTEGGAR